MANENTNPLPPEIQKMLSEQLRDVHLPDAVSWWPLAWGWWVLLILLTLSVGAALFLIVQKYKKNRYRKLATTELSNAFKAWQKDQQTLNDNLVWSGLGRTIKCLGQKASHTRQPKRIGI